MHKMRFFAVAASFVVCAVCLLSGCDGLVAAKPESTAPASTPLPMPSDQVPVSGLLDLYRSFVEQQTFRGVLKDIVDKTDYIVAEGGGNSAVSYKIGADPDVLAEYHAKPGEYIEVTYPMVDREFTTTPEYLVYNYYGRKNRYWSIIQLFHLSGYNSSYLGLRGSGIWVRQWPALEGNEEYKRFYSIEDAVQYVAHYGDL